MEKYLVITIDVEPDCSPTWHYSNPLKFEGIKVGIKERLQPLFDKYNIIPTYLINNVVLENDESVQIFKTLPGKYELGTHLHSEFIAPDKKFVNYSGVKAEANQCDLPFDIEYKKMANITELFNKSFGYRPSSFRAGRFSASKNTIRCLNMLGYKIDSSVTPLINWNDPSRINPVDYTTALHQPYFIKSGSYLESEEMGEILEVPVSIIKKRRFFKSKNIWLRPGISSYVDFIEVLKKIEIKNENRQSIVYNMMFHNVEVIPELSPYTLNSDQAKKYLNDLEKFFQYCVENQLFSLGLEQLYGKLKK